MKKNPEVDKFLKQKRRPLTEEIQRVRKIILTTDGRVEETIKWSSPTFLYKGNIASFYFNAKKMVSRMFHKGAAEGPRGLLEGEGRETQVARFLDMKDIEKNKSALQGLIKEWIRMQDG